VNSAQAATVRPIAPEPQPPLVINVVAFRDSKDVSDAFRSGRSVIVSLVDTPEEPRRRCIDFCSGVAHGLGGKMERISEGVFLMTQSTVSDEDRAKMKRQDLS
jgi:FtsZ-interacting cell division protein YlmF